MHLLNVYGVLRELAEQELIQKPYLMVYTWTNTLRYLKTLKDFDTPESDIKFYVKPITKRMVKRFYSDPKSEGDRASCLLFMYYIQSLEDFESTRLLWFLTGSDIIIIEKTEMSLNAMEGLARRPIIHICAPMLELPN